ncbi:MAG: DUF1080 domain-containing protein, partial [Planctomycetota bacterium]|nr:DUF1080 domain-containing protein [Planctomycetota bacterium]
QAEWYVRSDTSFYLDLRDNPDWRTFRAVAKGRDVHASLDGKALTPMVSGLTKSSISAFVHQACKDYQVEEARLRSLKPEEGAPAPAADPAAAVGEEKEIFNGKDLTGWKLFKGAWTVEDGAITNGTEASARLESLAQFANYELTFQVKIEAGRHAEVQVLNYTWYAEITRALAPDYKDCKVVVRGADVTVTLDGKALPLLSESNDKAVTSGPIGFYVPKDMKCRIKNVRVKPLK